MCRCVSAAHRHKIVLSRFHQALLIQIYLLLVATCIYACVTALSEAENLEKDSFPTCLHLSH